MRLRPALLALLLLLSGPLAAQTPQNGQGRLEIVGEAPGACVIRGPATATATNASYVSAGPSAGRLRITEMVGAGLESRAVTADVELEVVCNSPHRLVLRSENGGMRRVGASGRPQGPFAEILPYQLRASWLGQEASSATDGGRALVMQSNQGGAGLLSLGVVVPPGIKLVGGDYRDSVILEFRAAD
ncbi:MAG: hypothetical protein ACJ8ER_12615 [Allosphingosinicella sp.]